MDFNDSELLIIYDAVSRKLCELEDFYFRRPNVKPDSIYNTTKDIQVKIHNYMMEGVQP